MSCYKNSLDTMNNIDFDHDHNYLEDVMIEEEIDAGLSSTLIVYNDDHNTFDWVIESLMEVCNHTFEQSEQLSLIIHYKGKAAVKEGSFDQLKKMKDALVERGLSAVIENEVKS